ncbi:MAG: WD40 repeat domain-containing protein [Chloroflexi bacterium]|nr:WD40 repeat domain-containing protein [Chloroflexota bacterium]
MLLILVLFTACTPPGTDIQLSALPSPDVTPTAFPSPQPTRPPLPDWQKITAENATEIVELVRPNLGTANQAFWTPGGNMLFVVGEAGVAVYDGNTYALIKYLDASNVITGSALSPNGNLLVLATTGADLEFWDMQSLERTDLLPVDPLHWCSSSRGRVSFNSNGSLLAIEELSGHEQCTLIWDSELRGALYAMPGHIRPVFSPTDPNLLATYYRQNIYMRGAYDGEVLYYLPGSFDYQFSPDGELFVAEYVAEGEHDLFALWEVEKAVLRLTFPDTDEYISRVYFIDWQDNNALASIGADGGLIIWDLLTGETLETQDHDGTGNGDFYLYLSKHIPAPGAIHLWLTGMHASGNEITLSDHGGWITTFAFHPEQSKLFLAYNNQPAEIWDLTLGKLEVQIEEHIERTSSFDVSAAGDILLTEHDNFVLLRDAFSGTVLQRFNSGFLTDPRAYYLDSTDQVLIVGEEKNNNMWVARLTFWDPDSGELLDSRVMEGEPDLYGSRNISISPDERFIVSPQTGGTWVWDIPSGQRVALLQHMYGKVHIFDPSGEHLLGVLGDGTLPIWETSNWQQSSQIAIPEDAFLMAMDPEGQLLAVATSLADNVVIRDMVTNHWIATCQPDVYNIIGDIAFDPEGHLLAIAHDNHVAICDLATQEIIYETPGQAHWIPQVAFHPTGQFLISINWGGATQYWGVP